MSNYIYNLHPATDHCMSPVKVGPCRGHFPRWQYNGASQRCEEFIYGGCRGNLNNYLTRDECTNACEGSGKRPHNVYYVFFPPPDWKPKSEL